MTNSILTTTKKALGLAEEYEAFDSDIVMHINSVLFKLNQIGIGPIEGFSIIDKSATWGDFVDDDANLHAVKTFVYLSVRLLFDPPATSFAIAAMENQIKEFEWRLNTHREGVLHPWIDPATTTLDEL